MHLHPGTPAHRTCLDILPLVALGLLPQRNTGYAGVSHGSVVVDNTLFTKSLTYTSDGDQKQDFTAVDPSGVLDRTAAMPITSWDYENACRAPHRPDGAGLPAPGSGCTFRRAGCGGLRSRRASPT